MEFFNSILDFLKNNIEEASFITILCGIAATIAISNKLSSWVYLIISKFKKDPQIITGRWLLFIYNSDGIWKIDEYNIKQFNQSISGSIKRLYSGEDTTQELRKYDFKGYFYKDEIYYAFKPTSLKQSYGICILQSSKRDLEYEGFYYVPLNKRRGKKSRKTNYKIKLTKHLDEITDVSIWSKIHKEILKYPNNKNIQSNKEKKHIEQNTK